MIEPNDRCLIVEDNFVILMDLEDMVKGLGLQCVDLATNIDQAKELLLQHRYRIAFLDLYLGNESCLPLANILKKQGVPFAITTGYNVGDDLSSVLEGVPMISKPYAFKTVSQVLAELLGRPASKPDVG